MKINELIEQLKALESAYGDYEVFIKEDENNIRIVESVFFEEALLLNEDSIKNNNYFLIG